jgi:hypothetical protein
MRLFAAMCVTVTLAVPAMAQPAPNTLTAAEAAAGWRLLFDGATMDHWRGYKQGNGPAPGWAVADGCLTSVAGEGGVDLLTQDEFGAFELALEWRATPKANSGIIYLVTEEHDASWQTGPEYQVLDDAGNAIAETDPHSAGALYDLAAPLPGKQLKPAGEFNRTRIIVNNGSIRHDLNGGLLLQCRNVGAEWNEMIARSKFREYEGFGVQPRGHIALQHHGDAVSFRSIKVRDLTGPMPGEIRLFNGKDMTGWTHVLDGGGKMEDVWSVRDGMIVCKGSPTGYIRTTADYANYVLRLEWRWDPETKQAGNSGVLLRMVGADKVWPKSVEAQLESGSAGDFWCIDESPMRTDPARTSGRNSKKMGGGENPVGEWNEYEIIVDHGTITLMVNGEEANRATEVQEVAGKICLQSEGAPIQFRNIRLAPIP